jgi:uncharacterized protein YwqG
LAVPATLAWDARLNIHITMDKQQAIDMIRGSALAERADRLIEQLVPSARLVVHDDGGGTAKNSVVSHFGGLPSLPPGATWPVWDRHDFVSGQIERLEAKFRANPRATGLRDIATRMRQDLAVGPLPLLFLGQLSLCEIHAAAALPGWPRDGTLTFFGQPSAWGFDPLARGHCRVLFFPAHESLEQVPAPHDLPEQARFSERRVGFQLEWTLPTRIPMEDSDLSTWADEYRDLCRQLMGSLGENEPIHRCGGHPQEIQNDMRLECQLVTNGIYCGDSSGYRDPRRSLLEQGAADWQLLLQVDSDEKRLGWTWGDAGRLYFWTRQQDIEAADFEGSWLVLQCY